MPCFYENVKWLTRVYVHSMLVGIMRLNTAMRVYDMTNSKVLVYYRLSPVDLPYVPLNLWSYVFCVGIL